MATYELFTDKAGQYRFRPKAGNGQIILASEGYLQKASALSGIESVKKIAGSTRGTNVSRRSADGAST